MRGRIGSATVLAGDAPSLVKFYYETLGFSVKSAHNDHAKLENDGAQLAICSRATMKSVTRHPSYEEARCGQMFTLAFPLRTHEEVDSAYVGVVAKGATPIQSPRTMPWGQRAAFFADPEGNIHRMFADLPMPAECC